MLTKYGSEYGSWSIPQNMLTENSIVYSFGVGEDLSFDIELIKNHNPNVCLFDPTPRAKIFYEMLVEKSYVNQEYYDETHSYLYLLKKGMFAKTKYHEYGLSETTKKVPLFFPKNDKYVSLSEYNNGKSDKNIVAELKDLKTIMTEHGHSCIDILKMDIEGSEYGVIDSILTDNIDIKYMMIELHHIGHDIKDYVSRITKEYDLVYTKHNDMGFIKKQILC